MIIKMQGSLRVYEQGDVFRSKLYWAELSDHYLTFYINEKKPKQTVFSLNLAGCEIDTVYEPNIQSDTIMINSPKGVKTLLTPEGIGQFDIWKEYLLSTVSEQRNNSARESHSMNYLSPVTNNTSPVPRKRHSEVNEKPAVAPRRNITPDSQRYNTGPAAISRKSENYNGSDNLIEPDYWYSENRRKTLPSSNINDEVAKYQHQYEPRRYSQQYSNTAAATSKSSQQRLSKSYNVQNYPTSFQSRQIETVKEDPNMGDNEVLQTMSINEVMKKFPVPDNVNRWSIAATDLVGKTAEELYIFLIQLNRSKSQVETSMAYIEETIKRHTEELNNNNQLSSLDQEELKRDLDAYQQQYDDLYGFLEMYEPLILFLDSVVHFGDIFGGNNQTFHVVYHDTPASGEEDFRSVEFTRRNQERQVAKLIDEYKSVHLENTYPSLQQNARKQNHDTLILQSTVDWNHSNDYVTEIRQIKGVLDNVDTKMLELEPSKASLDDYMKNTDRRLEELNSWMNRASMASSGFTVEGRMGSDRVHGNRGSVKQKHKFGIDGRKVNNTLDDSAFKPKRSTRKEPRSDMKPSLERLAFYKKTNAPYVQLNLTAPGMFNPYVKEGYDHQNSEEIIQPMRGANQYAAQPMASSPMASSPAPPMRQPLTDRTDNSRTLSVGRSTNSRVQKQLMNIMNTQPYEYNEKNGLRNSSNSQQFGRDSVCSNRGDTAKSSIFNQQGPLIKLDVSRYSSMQRPSSHNYYNEDRINREESDSGSILSVPLPPEEQYDEMEQRLHLDQSLDNHMTWKNPSTFGYPSRPQYSDNESSINSML